MITFSHLSPFLKRQLKGILIITTFISIFSVYLVIRAVTDEQYALTHVTITENDGDGRRGMVVIWLFLNFIFTTANVLWSIVGWIKYNF